MEIDWDYNMTISKAIGMLENNNFSKKEYKDLILSYHIQRLMEKNNIQSTTPSKDQKQQKPVTTISQQKIHDQIQTSNNFIDHQFDQTQLMFQQIEQQNIPKLDESMNYVTSQSEKTMDSLQQFLKSSYHPQQQSQISDKSLEKEFQTLQTEIEQYKEKFQELTIKFKEHKEKFEKERKIVVTNQYQLLSDIKDAFFSPQ